MSCDFSISLGADASAFLQSLREMAESITRVMNAMREQIATMNQSGETAKRVVLYGADGMKIWEDTTRKTTDALKEQPKTLSELAESIAGIAGRAKPASSAIIEMRGQIKKTASATQELSERLQTGASAAVLFKSGLGMAQQASRFLSRPFEEFSKTENAAVRLAPLVGGMRKAKDVCSDLRKAAAGTGVSFESLTKYAAKLSSVFTDTEEIKLWAKALQNLEIGTGENMNDVLNSVIKAKASGRFDAGVMESFASKGINIFPELQAQTGKAKEQIIELARSGSLAFSEVETAILSVATGTGRFALQADALRGTFSGATAELVETFNVLLAGIAEGPARILTPVLKVLGQMLGLFDGMPARAVGVGLLAHSLWVMRSRITSLAPALKQLSFASAVKGAAQMKQAFLSAGAAATTGATQIGLAGIGLKAFSGVARIVVVAARGIRYALAGMVPFGVGIAIQLLIETLMSFCDSADESGNEIDKKFTASLEKARQESEKNRLALEAQAAGFEQTKSAAEKASESIKELTSTIGELRKAEAGAAQNDALEKELRRTDLTLGERRNLIAQKHGFSGMEELDAKRTAAPSTTISETEKNRMLDALREIRAAEEKIGQEKKAFEEYLRELAAKENGTLDQYKFEKREREVLEKLKSFQEAPAVGLEMIKLMGEAQNIAIREQALEAPRASPPQPPQEKPPAPTQEKVGGGIWSRIGTERASVGGGRVLNLGFNQSLKVAQEQLQVLKKIAAALDRADTPESVYA